MKIIDATGAKISAVIESIIANQKSANDETLPIVGEIIASVKAGGDKILRELSLKFDGFAPEKIELSRDEWEAGAAKCDAELVAVMRRAAGNIAEYHRAQIKPAYTVMRDGVVLGQRQLPLERAALYVPGGTAPLPSSVLMNAIPAKIAGVREVSLFTPPKKEGINPAILAAAKIAGVDKIFQVGGAQAIAAAAYGTETVPRADKIAGPGNRFVAAAKRLVYGECDIDMIAGPSEILIIADSSAVPAFVAADMLSQAEHDVFASAIVFTPYQKLAEAIALELEKQLAELPRREIAEESIKNRGVIAVVDDIATAISASNKIAPEHLELAVADPFGHLNAVTAAGSVFLGHFTPEPVGDYFAGTNHVLPTGGTARFSSPLGVEDFLRRSSYLYYTKDALAAIAHDTATFADAEGLTAHANSVRIRGKNE